MYSLYLIVLVNIPELSFSHPSHYFSQNVIKIKYLEIINRNKNNKKNAPIKMGNEHKSIYICVSTGNVVKYPAIKVKLPS